MNKHVHSTAVPANPARPSTPTTFTPPASLIEALAFDREMERNWIPELEQHFLANWQGIVDGKFPITSNYEAAALLQKMLFEFQDCEADFVQKIGRQVIHFLQRNSVAMSA